MNQIINIMFLIFKVTNCFFGFIASIITIYVFSKGFINIKELELFKNKKKRKKIEKEMKKVASGEVSKELNDFIKDYVEKEKWYSFNDIKEKEKESSKKMTGAIKGLYKDNIKPFIYAKEANMLYQVLFKMNALDFKKINNIAKTNSVRSKLTDKDLVILKKLEDLNSELISIGMNYELRKKILMENVDKIIDNIF